MLEKYFQNNISLLKEYGESLNFSELSSLRDLGLKKLKASTFSKIYSNLQKLSIPKNLSFEVSEGVIKVGNDNYLNQNKELLLDLFEQLIPWRTGPFQICNQRIDAEWQSFFKWDKIKDLLSTHKPNKILDIGCANGYFMYRALENNPRLVVGLDTSERSFFQFFLLQNFVRDKRLVYEPFGMESLDVYKDFFDCVICMGVLYHRRNPIASLTAIKEAMRPRGTLILETICIKGEGANAICIADRYAKMRNVYFVPTVEAVKVWLERSSFDSIEVIDVSAASVDEQRKTKYAPYESLEEFLSEDKKTTIEGHPLPLRVVFSAKRKKK